MQISQTLELPTVPFEGDQGAALTTVPEGARILRATATFVPVANDTVDLSFPSGESFGATRRSNGAGTEIDFHARRTLVAIAGTGLANAGLQIDLGGMWADLNDRGTLHAPGQALFSLPGAAPFVVPSLTVRRFQVLGAGPTVATATVQAVASNVKLTANGGTPLALHPGELSRELSSADFAELLATLLEASEVENGFHVLPLTVHTDTLARLEVRFELEIRGRRSFLAGGLDRVTLRYDHGGLPLKEEEPFELVLPSNARARRMSGRVLGSFDDSRVVSGPTGRVEASASVEVGPGAAQAQPLVFAEPTVAAGVDLHLAAVDRRVRLRLDLVEDFDGKPGTASFLAEPVTVELERSSSGEARWTSAALPAELELPERSWLLLQSLEGTARWSVVMAASVPAAGAPAAGAPAAGAPAAGVPTLQVTRDGGLAWRRSAAENDGEPLTALVRLRRRPRTFRMPIEVEVGSGAAAQRVSLRRLDAAERVDLGLDLPELVEGVNAYLDGLGPCPSGEHLVNGSFSEWSLGTTAYFSGVSTPRSLPESWTLTAGSVERPSGEAQLLDRALLGSQNEAGGVHALSQVVPVVAGCAYELRFDAAAAVDTAVCEVFWLGADCGPLTEDPVVVPVQVGDGDLPPLQPHVTELAAPPEAAQAEVRFLVEDGWVELTGVSLRGQVGEVAVPLAFIAEAPGELEVRDGGLEWDALDFVPPVPEAGLCAATPPGSVPGEAEGKDCCCAPEPEPPPPEPPPPEPSPPEPPPPEEPPPEEPPPEEPTREPLPARDATAAEARPRVTPVAELPRLDAALSAQLEAAGFATVEALQGADPEVLVRDLGLNRQRARRLVERAERFLGDSSP